MTANTDILLILLLGFLGPLEPVALLADMAMAIATVHWGKPIGASQGGGELPLTYIAVALAVLLAGPGAHSRDRALGLALPSWLAPALIALAAFGVALGLISRQTAQSAPAEARS